MERGPTPTPHAPSLARLGMGSRLRSASRHGRIVRIRAASRVSDVPGITSKLLTPRIIPLRLENCPNNSSQPAALRADYNANSAGAPPKASSKKSMTRFQKIPGGG